MKNLPTRLRPVSRETAAVIERMLSDEDPVTVKSGLQRACELLESGHAFIDAAFLTPALVKHVKSCDVKVRRWSYKLAGRLREKSLLPALLQGFLSEEGQDAENRSWAAAAYLGLASGRERRELMASLDQAYYQTELELAARLFAIGEPEKFVGDLRSFENNPLARKWLSILCGYAGTEPRTIDKRFSDLDLVRNAVSDDDPEIVEYSIWAEHRHPKGTYRKLLRRPHELMGHANVRRWLYRLLTKNEKAARANLDLLIASMDPLKERSAVAREGLALGLAPLHLEEVRTDSIHWFRDESSLGVKLALAEYLGRSAREDKIARDVLVAAYARLDSRDLLALKIESVLEPEMLAPVKRSRGLSSYTDQGTLQLELSPPQPSIIVMGDYNMSDNRIFSVTGSGNNISGVNLGEMIGSAINAVSRSSSREVRDAAPAIEQFLRSLDAEPTIAADEKRSAAELAQQAASAAEPDAAKSKLSLLKTVVKGLIAAPKVTETFVKDGHHLVETITGLLG